MDLALHTQDPVLLDALTRDAEMSAPYSRRPNERPRPDATEWEEASTNGRPRGLAYALWLQLWHWDAETEWGDIQNNVIFSYDKEFMKRLPKHLQASFDVLNGV